MLRGTKAEGQGRGKDNGHFDAHPWYLLCVALECEEADVTEDGLEGGGGNVGPVEHPVELGAVLHGSLQRGQENLRGRQCFC